MPVQNHIHIYVRDRARPKFYKCNAPDCTHFIKKEFIKGKLSLCTACGTQIVLGKEELRRAKPKCLKCSNTKAAIQQRKVQEAFRYLGTDAFQQKESFTSLSFNFNPASLDPDEPEPEELEE